MGNSSSTPTQKQPTKPTATPSYQLVHKLDDPNYGLIKLVRDPKTGEQIYLKEIICTTRAEFKTESNAFNKRIAVSHPNVVRILGCTAEDEPNVFSGYYKISVFIEVLQKTLADEFNVRLETGIPFSETDILLIAESLIAALSYFETQNIFHGDIRPANIFVTRHSYKLSDPYLNINKNANALSNAIVGDAKTLLAPQLLPQISIQDFTIRCNKFKADVFSLGATLLSLASLSQSEDLYDYDRGHLNFPLMKQRLEKVRRGYSKFTYDMIRSMLRINEDSRPDFISLANKLLPYQEDIRRKADLPFVGARASPPDDAQETEDAIEIQRWNTPAQELKRKVHHNALELERRSIDRQSFEAPLPARESRKSAKEAYRNSIPANSSQPQENVYTCNLDDEDYQYGQENDFNVLERFADETQFQGRYSHSPIKSSREQDRYDEQDSSIQNYNLPEQTKKSPVRSSQFDSRQPKYASPQRLPEQQLNPPQVQASQYYGGNQPTQSRAQLFTSAALPEHQISQMKVSYPLQQENKNRNQVQIPIGSLPSYNPVVAKTGTTPTATFTTAPIDDLEAKIRAALAQSESTIRSAGITKAQPSGGDSYQYHQTSNYVKPAESYTTTSYEIKKSYAPVEEKPITTSYTPTYEATPAYTSTYVSNTTPVYGSYPKEVSTSNVVIRESNVSSGGGYPIGGSVAGKTTTSGYYDVSATYPQYVSSTQYEYSVVPVKTTDYRYEAYSISPDVKTSYTDETKVGNLESYQRSYQY